MNIWCFRCGEQITVVPRVSSVDLAHTIATNRDLIVSFEQIKVPHVCRPVHPVNGIQDEVYGKVPTIGRDGRNADPTRQMP